MRSAVMCATLLAAALVAGGLWLRGRGPAVVDAASPPEAASAVSPSSDGASLARAVGIPQAPRRAPVESAAADPSQRVAGTAELALASIRGTVTRRREAYHPELVDQLRATLPPGVAPTPRELENGWVQLEDGLVVASDEPLAGIEVVVEHAGRSDTPPAGLRVVTDAAGGFRVDSLAPGAWVVRIQPPPETPRFRANHQRVHRVVAPGPGQDTVVDFSLPAESAAITGRVVDSTGLPLPRARLTAASIVDALHDESWGYGDVGMLEELRAETDDQGRYAVHGLMPATLHEAIRYAWSGASSVERRPQMVVVTAEADGHVSTRMLALPMTVALESSASSLLERLRSWSASIGEIEWLDVPIESPYTGGIVPVFRDGAQVLPDLVLARSATVAGRILDTRGDPLALAELRAVSTSARAPDSRPLVQSVLVPEWTRADERGAFRIEGLPPGSYAFEVRSEAAGLQEATNAPLEIGEGAVVASLDVIVRADEKGALTGTVVDALSGEPIEAFRVEIESTRDWSTADGKEGSFLVERVQEGPVTIRFRSEGYATQTLETVVRGGETSEVRTALSRSGTLEGRVTLDGAPAQGTLSAYPAGGPGEPVHHGWFEERFRIEGLRASVPHRLVAHVQLAPGSLARLVAEVVVTPLAGETVEQDLELRRPSATIRGNVRIRGELASWSVYVLEDGAFGIDEPELSPLLRATAEGRRSPEPFEVAVPAGSYTLLLRVLRSSEDGGPRQREERLAKVRVDERETESIDLEIR